MAEEQEENLGDNGGDFLRRDEEWQSLLAFYGEDDVTQLETNVWQISIGPYNSMLEVWLPKNYPSSSLPTPTFHIKPWVMDEELVKKLRHDLMKDVEVGMEVVLLWAEQLRALLMENNEEDDDYLQNAECDTSTDDHKLNEGDNKGESSESNDLGNHVFIPPTSKYHQPIRKFEVAIVDDENHRRNIHRGNPFRPPKSGPSELMIAHVASVTCLEHVQWTLAHLLFHDKKVAVATHNMFAYKFFSSDNKTVVSDNDDDGEKGSGSKLASLLEMTNAENVLVIVSRWYGGIHLGPARFKHIAHVAREVLDENGFITR